MTSQQGAELEIAGQHFNCPAGYKTRLDLERNFSIQFKKWAVANKDAFGRVMIVHGEEGVGKTSLLRYKLTRDFLKPLGFSTFIVFKTSQVISHPTTEFSDEALTGELASTLMGKYQRESDSKQSLKKLFQKLSNNGKVLLILDDVSYHFKHVVETAISLVAGNRDVFAICCLQVEEFQDFSDSLVKIKVHPMSTELSSFIIRDTVRNKHTTIVEKPELLARYGKICRGVPLLTRILAANIWQAETLQNAIQCAEQLEKHSGEQGYITKLLHCDFASRSNEFRRRFYAFLMFEKGYSVSVHDLAILWQTSFEEAREYARMLANFSLLESNDTSSKFALHSFVYDSTMRFACEREPSPELAIQNADFDSNRFSAIHQLRLNFMLFLAQKPYTKTGENALHQAVNTRREHLIDTMVNLQVKNTQLLLTLNSKQTIKKHGSEIPLHCFLKTAQANANGEMYLEHACHLADLLLTTDMGQKLLTNVKDVQGTAISKLFVDTLKQPERSSWRRNAYLVSIAKGYSNLLQFIESNPTAYETYLLKTVDIDYNTSLMIAGRHHNSDTVKELVQKLSKNGRKGQTWLDVNGVNRNLDTALLLATRQVSDKLPETLKALAEFEKINLNKRSKAGNTALMQLSSLPDTTQAEESLRFLIEKGASLEVVNDNLECCLHFAVKSRNKSAIRILVEKSPGLVKVKNDESCDPVWLACSSLNFDLLDILPYDHLEIEDIETLRKLATFRNVEREFEARFSNLSTATDIGYFDIEKPLLKLIRFDELSRKSAVTCHREFLRFVYDNNLNEILRLMNQYKSDLSQDKSTINSAFFMACYLGAKIDVVRYLMLELVADLSIRNRDGFNALHVACSNGHDEIVAQLLETRYFDPNLPGGTNLETCLHLSAKSGHAKVVSILLSKSRDLQIEIDLTASNSEGSMPLHVAARRGHTDIVKVLGSRSQSIDFSDRSGNTALMISAKLGNLSSIEWLASQPDRVNVDAVNFKQNTALLLATKFNVSHRIVTALLSQGNANPNIGDSQGWMPLMIAVQNKNLETIQALIADNRTDLNKKSQDGDTALINAVKTDCSLEIIKALTFVSTRINADITDKKGQTAFDWAENMNKSDICDVLELITSLDF